jgi:hypothetical protein
MPQLSEIISELSQNCLYLKALKQAKNIYSFCYNDLKLLSPYNVFQLLKKFNNRLEVPPGTVPDSAFIHENIEEESWHPSEFKLFSWIAVCYAYTINKEINEFVMIYLCRKLITSDSSPTSFEEKNPFSSSTTSSVSSASLRQKNKNGPQRKENFSLAL